MPYSFFRDAGFSNSAIYLKSADPSWDKVREILNYQSTLCGTDVLRRGSWWVVVCCRFYQNSQEKDFIFLVSDKKREQWACVTIPNVLFHIPIEMKEIGKLLNQKWLEESQKRSS